MSDVKATLSINTQGFKQGVDQAASHAEKSLKKVDAAGRSAGAGIGQAAKKLGVMNGAAGTMQNVSEAVGQLGGAFSGLASTLGYVAVAMAAVQLVMKLFEKLAGTVTKNIESVEERWKKLDKAIQTKSKEIQIIKQENNAIEGMLNTLNAYNNAQKLNNAQMADQERIVKQLALQYGVTGLQIDKTTGQVLGLAEAMDQLALTKIQNEKAEVSGKLQNIQEKAIQYAMATPEQAEKLHPEMLKSAQQAVRLQNQLNALNAIQQQIKNRRAAAQKDAKQAAAKARAELKAQRAYKDASPDHQLVMLEKQQIALNERKVELEKQEKSLTDRIAAGKAKQADLEAFETKKEQELLAIDRQQGKLDDKRKAALAARKADREKFNNQEQARQRAAYQAAATLSQALTADSRGSEQRIQSMAGITPSIQREIQDRIKAAANGAGRSLTLLEQSGIEASVRRQRQASRLRDLLKAGTSGSQFATDDLARRGGGRGAYFGLDQSYKQNVQTRLAEILAAQTRQTQVLERKNVYSF